jgi:hypothetical protein
MTDLMQLPSTRTQSYRRRDVRPSSRLRDLGDAYLDMVVTARGISADIAQAVTAAQAAGQSLAQISDASGLSVSQIEYILVAEDVQRRRPAL